MGINQLVALVFGTICAGAALWVRSGKAGSRSLFGGGATGPNAPRGSRERGGKQGGATPNASGFLGERFLLLFLPGLALFFLSMGLLQLSVLPSPPLKFVTFGICLCGVLAGLGGMAWGLFSLPYPDAFRPRWLRAGDRERGKNSPRNR